MWRNSHQTRNSSRLSVTLDPVLNVRNHAGFSPTTYRDKPTGFEFNLNHSADLHLAYPPIAPQVGDRDTCASFRWGGDLDEMAAALYAASALAKCSDGIYYYPDDDILYTAGEAVEATRADLSSL